MLQAPDNEAVLYITRENPTVYYMCYIQAMFYTFNYTNGSKFLKIITHPFFAITIL